MPTPKTLQTLLWVIILGSSLGVLTRVVLAPSHNNTAAEVTLPKELPLTGWQPMISAHSSTRIRLEPSTLITSEHYQYQKNDLLLDIQMRYLVNTDGDIVELTERYTHLMHTSLVIRQVGDSIYSLETNQHRAYLNACIMPDGDSTVTSAQFLQRQSFQNTSPARLALWAIGQIQIQDRRCLWSQLSISLEKLSTQEAYQVLENAWLDWRETWQTLFPNI
jgi:cyanosortase A-associated protein